MPNHNSTFDQIHWFLDYMTNRFYDQDHDSFYVTSSGLHISTDVSYAYDCIQIMKEELCDLEERIYDLDYSKKGDLK